MKAWVLWPVMALLLSGCASGIDTPPHLKAYIFTYAKYPYTPDLHDTSVSDISGHGRVIRLKEPLSGYGVSVEFDSNAIGDIAKEYGLDKVYFADIRELNILGVFRRRQLFIYGEKGKVLVVSL